MARGDLITVLTANQPNDDTTDRQPGAGIEEACLFQAIFVLEGSAPNGAPAGRLQKIDGTNIDAYVNGGNLGEQANGWMGSNLISDNTNYVRLQQQANATGDYGFAVMVVG